MNLIKNNHITHCKVAADEIKKIRFLYAGGESKTVAQWQKESGADIVVNASLFNTDGTPIEGFIYNGRVLSRSDWCTEGFGINHDGSVMFGKFNTNWLDFTVAFPMLVKFCAPYINFEVGAGVSGKHPRTVFSQTSDGGIMISTFDGRADGAPGAEIEDMPAELIANGAMHSANLDGGGSTRLMVNGEVVNVPCEDRAVPVVLAVWLKGEEKAEPQTEEEDYDYGLRFEFEQAHMSNFRNYRRDTIKYLVYHYTGNNGDDAQDNIDYYKNTPNVGASAHYFLDELGVAEQSVKEGHCAWHCGTNGTYKHPYCRNDNSIGIEMCAENRNGSGMPATDKGWYFTEATVQNAVKLGKYLMKKYDIPIENVLRHYDVTGKICPAPFVHDESEWERFKAMLVAEDEPEEYTEPEDIVLQLKIRGLVLDTEGMLAEMQANPDGRLYWLARKSLAYMREKE